jgi:hypothetical protein
MSTLLQLAERICKLERKAAKLEPLKKKPAPVVRLPNRKPELPL